jgi:hypothetical protein
MRYVQYYIKNDKEFFQGLGDRSVVILDGRNTIKNSIKDAIKFNSYCRPTYDGFKLYQGESIMRSKPITDLITFERGK